jgi:hypothetical protein
MDGLQGWRNKKSPRKKLLPCQGEDVYNSNVVMAKAEEALGEKASWQKVA